MTEEIKKDSSQGGNGDVSNLQGQDFDPKSEVEKLKKELADTQRKFGEIGSQYEQLNDYIQGSSIVINTVASDPDLRKRFQDTLEKQYGAANAGGQADKQQKQEPSKEGLPAGASGAPSAHNPVVDDVVAFSREKVFEDFENKYGILGMDREDRKQTWQNIEMFFRDFDQSVKTTPLATLERNLERAYMAISANKLRDEGKLEGFAQARNNAYGMMPSVSGGVINEPEGSGKLTSKQAEIARKMGVDPERAAKIFAARDAEDRRIPPAEKTAKKPDR